jgi:hypothetical protein
MREVRIHLPEGDVEEIARLAFAVGIRSVSLNPEQRRHASGKNFQTIALEAATSTPKARRFIDSVLKARCYDPAHYTINVKSPRSIISDEPREEITHPRLEPAPDLADELWQFCHTTTGLCGRIVIGAWLLAFGLVENKILLIVAGLLFLPLLPTLTGISFGLLSREWRLVARAALTLGTGLLLTFAASALIGLIASPPVRFDDFSSWPVSALISAAVGVAASLASTDDAGRRELIGLAAAAQVAILPAWLGLALTMGVPEGATVILERLMTLFLNIIAISSTSYLTFAILGYRTTKAHE